MQRGRARARAAAARSDDAGHEHHEVRGGQQRCVRARRQSSDVDEDQPTPARACSPAAATSRPAPGRSAGSRPGAGEQEPVTRSRRARPIRATASGTSLRAVATAPRYRRPVRSRPAGTRRRGPRRRDRRRRAAPAALRQRPREREGQRGGRRPGRALHRAEHHDHGHDGRPRQHHQRDAPRRGTGRQRRAVPRGDGDVDDRDPVEVHGPDPHDGRRQRRGRPGRRVAIRGRGVDDQDPVAGRQPAARGQAVGLQRNTDQDLTRCGRCRRVRSAGRQQRPGPPIVAATWPDHGLVTLGRRDDRDPGIDRRRRRSPGRRRRSTVPKGMSRAATSTPSALAAGGHQPRRRTAPPPRSAPRPGRSAPGVGAPRGARTTAVRPASGAPCGRRRCG